MCPFPLRGTWTEKASIHQFPLPIPPSLLLSINSTLLPPLLLGLPSLLLRINSTLPPPPPLLLGLPPSNLPCTSHEVDLPLPLEGLGLAFFPVSSSHEAFFLKCAVLIKLIPLPPEAFFLCCFWRFAAALA